MSKDREPQDVGAIEQELHYKERARSWDFIIGGTGIFIAVTVGPAVLASSEPGSAVRLLSLFGPAMVGFGAWIVAFERGEKINYLRGKMDGILQEVQRTATLANQPASQ